MSPGLQTLSTTGLSLRFPGSLGAIHSNTGLIAGAAFGGSAALILIMLAVWFYVRRKRSPNMTGQPGSSVPAMEGGTESITTPYVRSNPADSAGTPFASPYFDNDAVSPPIGPSSSGYYSTNPASSSIPGGYAPYSPPTTMQSPTSSRQNRPSRQNLATNVRVNAAEKALPQAAQNAKEKGLHSSPDVEP
ncbi:hypothetical protein M408DRAFT_305734 [Serendipita vermifera MAFF 305830]|uniref:Uncharacterized protein n=1 Tax=Serendipita vermifera MAFF 305830 TaxID=933852 RepID=A0A0C2W3E1_SERVB|nr:hypothetical protein M408DRAFT_305734 [Serendipita vermifera MAFF 305830]